MGEKKKKIAEKYMWSTIHYNHIAEMGFVARVRSAMLWWDTSLIALNDRAYTINKCNGNIPFRNSKIILKKQFVKKNAREINEKLNKDKYKST